MEKMKNTLDNLQSDTIREPEKQFGPRGTLKIPVENLEESGVYERDSLNASVASIDTPPKRQDFQHEAKVIIKDDNDEKKMVELRGGMVEVVPVIEQKFDLTEIETNLGRVQMGIKEAQDEAGRAQTPEQRGMAMKKLTELKREKDALDAQLPFARMDELKNVKVEYESQVKRYQELVTKQIKSPREEAEFKALAEKLPIEKARVDQLNQSMAFRKEKGLSTGEDKKTLGAKISGWFRGLFGKK